VEELKTWEDCYLELAERFIERNAMLMFLLGERVESLYEVKKRFEALSPVVQESIREGSRKMVEAITVVAEEPKPKIRKTLREAKFPRKKKASEPIPTE
jgi:hypothetical protein